MFLYAIYLLYMQEDEGADELVFLDITATNDGRKTMLDVVEKVAKEVFIPFTVGATAQRLLRLL